MSQGKLNLTGPLEFEPSEFWGLTSRCQRFSIRSQTTNGKTEHVLWRHGKDGRVIPKHLGVFDTMEKAREAAEEAKYGELPKYNKIRDWEPLWRK